MKLRTIFYGLTSGLLLGLSSCSLNYEPLDTYSDVTEGVTSDGTKIVFKDKAAVESHLTTLYNQMRDRQEHWYVDLLLISVKILMKCRILLLSITNITLSIMIRVLSIWKSTKK